MQRKVMATVVISLVFCSQLLFLFTQDVKAEGVSNPKAVEYVFSGNDVRTELRRDQSVFMNYFQARSNIAEDVGEGRKITKIEFLMAGEVVKTISVNSRTFNQSVVFDGKEIKVVSKGNIANGSWFAWTIGNNIRNGHAAWEAAGEEGDWGIISSVTPPQEPHGRFMFDKYPGHEIWMKVNYSRSVEFKNEELGQFPTTVIDRAPNRLSNWNPMQVKAGDRADSPGNVRRLMRQEILGPNGITGVTDPSTEITNIQFDSLDAATIRFTQDHKKLGVMSSGGAQTFFFANYEYDITSYTYRYPNVYRVYSVEDPSDECEIENPECVPTPPSGQCTVVEGTPVTNEVSNPNVSAVIKADQRDNEQFNVIDGIPTSESLYGNVSSLSYLFKNKFTQMVGTCTYDVPVTQPYNMEWTEPGPNDADGNATEIEMSDSTNVTKNYTVRREFTYWVISNFEVHSLKKATLENYAFNGNKIEILPQGYSPPTYATATTGGYTAPPAVAVTNEPKTVGKEVPDEDFTGDAEAAIEEVRVRNDSLTFKGQTVMDNAEREKTGPAPGTIPQPAEIGRDVLYKPNNRIPITKENRLNEQSQGSIEYGLMPGSIGGGEEKSFTIEGINTVTVHTPVVNYSWATDDQAHNQKTTPNGNRAAFILDRPFTVRIPTSGQHTNYLGYGNRDYAKYFRTKQVRFPFDVYTADQSGFYAKNTWIDIPVNQLDTTFFLPVWVDEGDYTVEFRNIAENAPDMYPSEQDANLNLINHIASDTINVEVIGRLYDFHITDVADYNWEMVFRTMEGSATHTGNTYWTGLLGIDGATRGNVSPFTLPILPGSNPLEGTKNVSVKTGYHIKFDLKTKGNMFGKTDGIRITPSFTFVSKDGKTKTPVDLYYNDDHRTFIQVGSPEDTQERYVILNDRLRNVPEEELTDTARYKYDHDYTFAEMNNVSREMFISDYIRRFTKEKTPVGGFDLLLLPEQIRTLIGPKTNLPSSVDYARANAAVQKWYGQYSLPGDPYVVKKGTNLAEYGRTHGGLTRRDPIFLRDGYIVLNFNIESIREGNLSAPHLQYMNAPLMNQWTLEGFKHTVQDSWNNTFSLKDGDIVFYNADKSYKDDFQAEVSH